MAFHTHELEDRFNDETEPKRLELDDVLRFMHHSQKELRDQWILPLYNVVVQDQPEFAVMPGLLDELMWVARDAPENIRDAFFFCCLAMYPQVANFVLKDPHVATANDDALCVFIKHPRYLPRLCDRYRRVDNDIIDTDAFVRAVRHLYQITVGFIEKPYIRRVRVTHDAVPKIE